MQRLRVKLALRKTRDGLMEVRDGVPLGTRYEVDADSVQLVKGYNLAVGTPWARLMIQDVATGTWLPVEVLELLEDA